ncbi:MAG: hypothetical protein ABFD04_14300 [Syntrophomonas sp.]
MQLKFGAKKITALLLAGIISIIGAGIAFAVEQSNSQPNAHKVHAPKLNPEKMSAIYQSVLESLVSAGTITQTQADAIIAGKPTKDGKERTFAHYNGPWSKLVVDGTITQEQADAIKEAMKSARDAKKSFTDVMAELVSAGTITQEQADAITSGRPTNDGKERTFGNNKSPWTKLVVDGTITQAQEDAIKEAMKSARDAKKSLTDVMAELVSAGTITQEQADAITAGRPNKDGKERTFAHNNGPWSKLVVDGTITQEQADAIRSALIAAIDAAMKSE